METTISCEVEKALDLFVEAVELSSDLEIIGTAIPNDEEVFVIRDYSKIEGLDGAYVEVSIKEVVEKVSSVDMSKQFIDTITNDRKPIVLHGITRIVGYYSRVNNWNKSKVGELRDRAQRNYGLTNSLPQHDKERIDRVNNLS